MRRASAGVSLVQARLRRTLDGRRRMGEATDLLPSVLQEVVAQSGVGEAAAWVLQAAHLSGTQVAVLMVGAPGQPAAAVVKMPATPDGVASQRREAEALAALRAEPSLGELAELIPGRLAEGELGGVAYTVERAVPGVEGRMLLGDPSVRDQVVAAAAGVIGRLHRATSASVVVDDELLERWVGSRVRLLAPATRNAAALERLEQLLRRAWEGRSVDVAWVHGDYWPANVIFGPELAVTGIIDWEWAAPRELPAHDLLYLAIHLRMRSEGREFGPVVQSLLAGNAGELAGTADRETLLLVWLRHVAYNLTQSPGDARNWIWTSRNVDTVLRLL
jgi:aminoglycoside phosphotransferase (APT) family kinase protein